MSDRKKKSAQKGKSSKAGQDPLKVWFFSSKRSNSECDMISKPVAFV
jgi:hypothetical protein